MEPINWNLIYKADWHRTRGWVTAMELQGFGRHFTFMDDDERPWVRWNHDMIQWLKSEVGEDNYTIASGQGEGRMFVLFRRPEDHMMFRLAWG